MVDLGIDAYRLSISWSRLCPGQSYLQVVSNQQLLGMILGMLAKQTLKLSVDNTGAVNQGGVAFYNKVINDLVHRGSTYSTCEVPLSRSGIF